MVREALGRNWRELLFVFGLVVVIGLTAYALAAQTSCEELGGTLYQVGTREETYVTQTVKVGEISVPIYGQRTVPVFDCLGER